MNNSGQIELFIVILKHTYKISTTFTDYEPKGMENNNDAFDGNDNDEEWQQVGPNRKPMVTRSV